MRHTIGALAFATLVGCSEFGVSGDPNAARGAASLVESSVLESTATATESEEGLCFTQGFWANHPDEWPVTSLVLGDREYTAAEADAFLAAASWGDASLILAAQLVATELNLASGSPDGIQGTVDLAHAWISARDDDSALPFGTPPQSPEGQEAVALATTLDDYNNNSNGACGGDDTDGGDTGEEDEDEDEDEDGDGSDN